MKSPDVEADATLALDRSARGAEANQTWPDARGETTEPGPPPRLDAPLRSEPEDDDGRTQPNLIGPGGKLVGFGGLRPDVKVQAESAGRSAARYEAKAAPARSVLPVEAETARRIVVNQTQPMGLPMPARADAPPGDARVPAEEAEKAAADNDTVPRARRSPARRPWLAALVGVGLALVIALVVVYAGTSATTTSPRSAAATAGSASAAATPRRIPSATGTTSVAAPASAVSVGKASPLTSAPAPGPAPPNGSPKNLSSPAIERPHAPAPSAGATSPVVARPSAVAPLPAVVPFDPKRAPSSGDILRSQ